MNVKPLKRLDEKNKIEGGQKDLAARLEALEAWRSHIMYAIERAHAEIMERTCTGDLDATVYRDFVVWLQEAEKARCSEELKSDKHTLSCSRAIGHKGRHYDRKQNKKWLIS